MHSHPISYSDSLLDLFASLSGKSVHFFPHSGNAGDGLIMHSTYVLFEKFGISAVAHRQDVIAEDGIVLIGGGGNLIEGSYDDVAKLVRSHGHVDQIIILPQSIIGFADVLARTHNNLTVFCRDKVSYEQALINGAHPGRLHLVQDMALYLPADHFSQFFQSGELTLRALRVDSEAGGVLPLTADNVDLSLSWNGDIWTSPKFCELAVGTIAAFIAPYHTVITDRLHITILSAYLGKQVVMLPNSYFKNRAVYEHSLASRFPNIRFVDPRAMSPVTATVSKQPMTDVVQISDSGAERAALAEEFDRERASLEIEKIGLQTRIDELERAFERQTEDHLQLLQSTRFEVDGHKRQVASERGARIALAQRIYDLELSHQAYVREAETQLAELRNTRNQFECAQIKGENNLQAALMHIAQLESEQGVAQAERSDITLQLDDLRAHSIRLETTLATIRSSRAHRFAQCYYRAYERTELRWFLRPLRTVVASALRLVRR